MQFSCRVFAPLFFCALLVCVALGATATPAKELAPRILVMGDSLLASHAISGRSVGDYLRKITKAQVDTRPVLGARMIYKLPITGALGMSIPKQFSGDEWSWVVLNGGGNDLWLGCGCNRCARKLERLISADGTRGAIPSLVGRIRKTGAKVIYVGYLRSPGFDSPIENCRDEGDALEARIAKLAELDPGVTFQALTDLVPEGDLSFHAADRIHPSLKASKAIAARIAQIITDR